MLLFLPRKNDTAASIKNTMNSICAIPDAAPAMPPKPSTAAMIAMIKNDIDQLNIMNLLFSLNNIDK
jgi:hypothetical protein